MSGFFWFCYNVIMIECYLARNALHCLFLETFLRSVGAQALRGVIPIN